MTSISTEHSRKRLELLRELLPRLSHVGILGCGLNFPVSVQEWAETKAAAELLGVRVAFFKARDDDGVERAFGSAAKQRVQAIVGFDCADLMSRLDLIAAFSLRYRLPVIYQFNEVPRLGGLMSYGPNLADTPRRAAVYVDKILKGANPADLPVQQPLKFELVINLKTAKALGLTIPPALLARADELIQ